MISCGRWFGPAVALWFAGLSAGCGRSAGEPAPITSVTSALSVAGARILGFETPLADWSASSGTRTASTTRSEGSFSLGISGTGNTTLTSAPIDSLVTVGDAFTVDVSLPSQQAGATFGVVQLFIDLPSRGINNAFVGQRDLVGLPTARFHRLAFALPANIRTALQATYSDLRVRLVLNAPSSGGTWLFDRGSFDVMPPDSPTPSIEQRLVALEGQVTTLQGQVTTLQGQVGGLQAANTALTSRVGALETGLAASNGRISTLEAQNATLAANVAALTTRTTALEAQTAANAAAIATLGGQLAVALARIAALEAAALPPALVAQLQSITQHLRFETIETLPALVFTGVNLHVRDGSESTRCTDDCTGLGNVIIGYNEANGILERTGSHNLVIGSTHQWTSYGGIVAGSENQLRASSASILAGTQNIVRGIGASIGGGSRNLATGRHSHISGGSDNQATNEWAIVVGGAENIASGESAVVLAGLENQSTSRGSVVVSGIENIASGIASVVAGGEGGLASASAAAILGGHLGKATGEWSSVSGGFDSRATGDLASVAGGRNNIASRTCAAVSGGLENVAEGVDSVVGGGFRRTTALPNSWRAGDLFQPE